MHTVIAACLFSACGIQVLVIPDGTITKEEYDDWRYHYPEKDTGHRWAKVPSQELMNMIFKDQK